MFTFKNWAAVGLFLFGTTFLWLTRAFLADARQGTGTVWTVVQVLAVAAIVGFSIAAWLVFKGSSGWEPIALVSAAIGLVSLVPYVIGIRQVGDGGDPGVQMNVAIHAFGAIAVVLLVVVPVIHDWFAERI